jgi:hypothetical protein
MSILNIYFKESLTTQHNGVLRFDSEAEIVSEGFTTSVKKGDVITVYETELTIHHHSPLFVTSMHPRTKIINTKSDTGEYLISTNY